VTVKVLALIYGDEAKWETVSEQDREAIYAKYRAFGEQAGGKIADGARLASTRSATTVRVRDGKTVVTDGPFAETKEQLGGFYLFDVDSLDEATELAKSIPGQTVEVRAAREDES
jgi:hypothetical protein